MAQADARLAGCVLYRVLDGVQNAAECKRLYVPPEYRGGRIATRLMDAIEAAARMAGLEWMYLDSKADFLAAIAMYKRRGYRECARYNDNPQATLFFRKQIGSRFSIENACDPAL